MTAMARLTLLVILLSVFGVGAACNSSPTTPEARTIELGKQIRCPVCRGVSIADSPSSLAAEMMAIVRQQVAEGKSDQEVLTYFEERYGEWALLKPKAEGMNLAIWILPGLFLVGGAGFILSRIKKQRGE